MYIYLYTQSFSKTLLILHNLYGSFLHTSTYSHIDIKVFNCGLHTYAAKDQRTTQALK